MTTEYFLYLCLRGSVRQVREALEAGADPNAHDRCGNSALNCAAHQNSTGIIELLLRFGADVNAQIRDEFDRTGTHTALLSAVCEGNPEAVGALLKGGADIEARIEYGETALMCACSVWCRHRHVEVAARLLEAGADIEARNEWGDTALMYAARAGLDNVVAVLLEAGANVNARDDDGQNALRHAIMENRHETAALLLKAVADVHAER